MVLLISIEPSRDVPEVQRRREAAQDDDDEGDAHSMTSSPNGVVDPSVAMERMSCNIEKQVYIVWKLSSIIIYSCFVSSKFAT